MLPPETIEKRFPKVFEHLPEAISKADHTVLYDNSGNEEIQKVAELNKGSFQFETDVPHWASKAALSSVELDINNATSEKQIQDALARSEEVAKVNNLNARANENTQQLSRQNELRNARNNEGYSL